MRLLGVTDEPEQTRNNLRRGVRIAWEAARRGYPEAEAAIFAELKQQLAGRIGIVISHRFSTVRIADRIYVIHDGRVLESGTHDALVAARGRYAELFELQAAGYR